MIPLEISDVHPQLVPKGNVCLVLYEHIYLRKLKQAETLKVQIYHTSLGHARSCYDFKLAT
jgi:hypothetical protein